MDLTSVKKIPNKFKQLETKCQEIGFTMPSDVYIGTLLKSLMVAKPQGHFLELGTGIGLSLAWMEEGLTEGAKLTSIDNNPELIKIANSFFGENDSVELICQDGTDWIKNYSGNGFDLIFADAWPGKYSELEEILSMVNTGGFYVIDDMMPQPNWPDGHFEKANDLLQVLEARTDFSFTKLNWSTGIVMMTKKYEL